MNIFINMGSWPEDMTQDKGRSWPLLYFWFKDHYFQQSPKNFNKTNWFWFDSYSTEIQNNKKIQQDLENNPPNIFLISLYLWNEPTLLSNAKWIKQKYPNCTIVAGGPSADATLSYLKQNSFIDYVILGPGQEIFRRFLDNKFLGKESESLGIAFLRHNTLIKNPDLPRKENLLLLDYVNNFTQEVIQLLDEWDNAGHTIVWLSLMIQGCPYTCSFCEQGTELWSKIQKRPLEQLYDEIDIVSNYKRVQMMYIDSNIGIHKDYVDLYEYLIAQKYNKDWPVELIKADYAKNNVDRIFLLQKMAYQHGLTKGEGMIALQDIDQNVLKLNGRPGDKDEAKMENLIKLLNEYENRVDPRVDIILGMPGQTIDSLCNTLLTLYQKKLVERDEPNLFFVIPNTRIVNDPMFKHVKHRKIKRRRMTRGKQYIDLHNENYPVYQGLPTVVKTETLQTIDLVSMHYAFPLFGHLQYIDWLSTPMAYLKNYYNVDETVFLQSMIQNLVPANHEQLPDSIREDLESYYRLLSGQTQLIDRIDNDNLGYIAIDHLARYRFIANNKDWLQVLENTMKKFIKIKDQYLPHLLEWTKLKTLSLDVEYPRKYIGYNWDDIANQTETIYYQNIWEFDFNIKQRSDLVEKIKISKDIQYICHLKFKSIKNPQSLLHEELLITG